jgi:hypothetical protein
MVQIVTGNLVEGLNPPIAQKGNQVVETSTA